MITTIIIYIACSAIFEAIYLRSEWKRAKAKFSKKKEIQAFWQHFREWAIYKNLKQKVWNPYTIVFIITPFFILFSSLAFPLSLYTLIRKALGIKTKLEKKAEAEEKFMEEVRKRHEEWMKKEGDMNPNDPHFTTITDKDFEESENDLKP